MNNEDFLKSLGVEKLNLKDQLKELAPKYTVVPQIKPFTQDQDFVRTMENIQKKANEREKREILMAENSTKSVELLEEHVKLQKEMIEILKTKIDSANHALDLLLNSLGANSQKTQEELIENRKLLTELKTLIETDKNGNSIKRFIAEHGIESISLVAQLISMILGGK